MGNTKDCNEFNQEMTSVDPLHMQPSSIDEHTIIICIRCKVGVCQLGKKKLFTKTNGEFLFISDAECTFRSFVFEFCLLA